MPIVIRKKSGATKVVKKPVAVGPRNCDGICNAALENSKNMLIPWYLMASYLYYERDISIISDDLYDVICKRLDEDWDTLVHDHKHFVSRQALKAGTGHHLNFEALPVRIRAAAMHLVRYELNDGDSI